MRRPTPSSRPSAATRLRCTLTHTREGTRARRTVLSRMPARCSGTQSCATTTMSGVACTMLLPRQAVHATA
eukprot:15471769-Alexandrium_andersonii.AAC.1